MLIIKNALLDNDLNYPVINKTNNYINYINTKIQEDVICFKEVIKEILIEEKSNIPLNLKSTYKITFNKNNIISIPMEFTQFIEQYNINYINTYNYDFNLEKEIKIKDIFNEILDYKTFLSNLIKIQITLMLEDSSNKQDINEYDLINMIFNLEIYEDQAFYLEDDGLVICISSYEMGSGSNNVLEFKIMYEDAIDYFSEYFLREILLYMN